MARLHTARWEWVLTEFERTLAVESLSDPRAAVEARRAELDA